MSRRQRSAPAGWVYHVMNRAAGNQVLFKDPVDFRSFQRLLAQAQERYGMRIIAYCLMGNHWHFLLWPSSDDAIGPFIHWLCTEHGKQWRRSDGSVGRGAVYQGRYRLSVVQCGQHLFTVWRYIERNALRAGLVDQAEKWPWSSLSDSLGEDRPQLSPAPLAKPQDWLDIVNRPQTLAELGDVRDTLDKDRPYGDKVWTEALERATGWRPRGRPKKVPYSF